MAIIRFMKILERLSAHQLAAAVVAGTSAFGELLVGPFAAPVVELGASLLTSAIAAHAVSARSPVRPSPRRVGQALVAGARASGSRCAAARWLRVMAELQGLPGARRYALRTAGRTLFSVAVGGGAKAALKLVPGAGLGMATLQAVMAARDAWRFVAAVERESQLLALPITGPGRAVEAPAARLATVRQLHAA